MAGKSGRSSQRGKLVRADAQAKSSRAELIEAALDVRGLLGAPAQTRAAYGRACKMACDAISEKVAAPPPNRSQVMQSLEEVVQLADRLASKLGSPNVARAIDLTVTARDEEANGSATYEALGRLKHGLDDARQVISDIALACSVAPARLGLSGSGTHRSWGRFEVAAEVWAAWFCLKVVMVARNLTCPPGKENPVVADAIPLIWEAATGEANRDFQRAIQTARLTFVRDPEDGSVPPQVAYLSLRLEIGDLLRRAGVR